MNSPEQNMKSVSAKNVSQFSDAKKTKQNMENIKARDAVDQKIENQREQNSLSIFGFGNAKGFWAVIIMSGAFALVLFWKYCSAN